MTAQNQNHSGKAMAPAINSYKDLNPEHETLLAKKLLAYEGDGTMDSHIHNGNPEVLDLCLQRQEHKAIMESDTYVKKRDSKIKQRLVSMAEKTAENDKLRAEIQKIETSDIPEKEKELNDLSDQTKKEIEATEKEIGGLRAEKIEIKNKKAPHLNSEAIPGDRLGFRLGAVILSFLSIFLILFYNSIIYSSFILDVNNATLAALKDGKIFSTAIVNLNALVDTYQSTGLIGVLFILAAAFMFLALGYLIHKFNEEKSFARTVAIYSFTFAFDALLAFEIVQKIYVANYNSGSYEDPWQFHFAFTDVAFWTILCAGFSMYIVFGLILNYVLKEYNKLHPEIMALHERDAEIKALQNKIKTIKAEAKDKREALKADIRKLKDQLKPLHDKIAGYEVELEKTKKEIEVIASLKEVPVYEVKAKVNAYGTGWINYLSSEFEGENQQEKIRACLEVIKAFLGNMAVDSISSKSNGLAQHEFQSTFKR